MRPGPAPAIVVSGAACRIKRPPTGEQGTNVAGDHLANERAVWGAIPAVPLTEQGRPERHDEGDGERQRNREPGDDESARPSWRRRALKAVQQALRTIRSNPWRALAPGWKPSKKRKALRYDSCTASWASSSFRISQRARLWASFMSGTMRPSKRARVRSSFIYRG